MALSSGSSPNRKTKYIFLCIVIITSVIFWLCYNQILFVKYKIEFALQTSLLNSKRNQKYWISERVENNSVPSTGVLVTRSDGYGLGNHLFLYALSYTLSRNLKIPLVIPLPSEARTREHLKNLTSRKFILDHFSLPKGIFVNDNDLKDKEVPYQVECEEARDVSLIPKEILRKTKYFILAVFCFDEKYFEDFEEELQSIKVKVDSPSESYQKWKDLISRTELPIAVHVRRGDIEKQYWSAPAEYFQEALRRIKQEVPRGQEAKVFVFSDDIDWAKENLVGSGLFPVELGWPIYFVSGSFGGLTNLEELDLMIRCKSIVISNSTYSWWAAYLMKSSESRKKIVIRPQFNETKHNQDPLGLNGEPRQDYYINYPPEWIAIDT